MSGRALLQTLKLKEQRSLKILTIYASNSPGKNRDFWNTIKDYFEQNPNKKPDIMAGDFNMVEDSLDRLPTHNDQEDTTEALDNLKQALELEDGWRNIFPHKAAYTYLQSNGTKSQSRIDRIYSKPCIIATAREWKITTTAMPHADHKMVSVKIVDKDAPQTGRGRWSLFYHLITDGLLLKYIKERSREALQEIDKNQQHRTDEINPQVIYFNFKRDIINMAQKREKAIVPKLTLDIKKCEYNLEIINNDPIKTLEEKMIESEQLNQKLTSLKRKQHLKNKVLLPQK